MSNRISGVASPETVVDLGRLNALSDGVFAFALTLLVLDIRIPENILAGDIPASLLNLAPKFLIYLISFVVIGGGWGSHQRLLSQIRRGDGLLVWFNLLSLLFVTLLPAAANLLGRFPEAIPAVICFAVDVVLIQLSALWLWRHASRNNLINPNLDKRVVVSIGRRLSLNTAAFGLSILVALLNPILGYVLWVGVFLLIFTTDWLSWQQATRTKEVSVPLSDAARGQISLSHSIGHLTMQPASIQDVFVKGIFGGGLDSQVTREGDLVKANLSFAKQQGLLSFRYPWTWGPENAIDWDVTLTPQIPLTLNIHTRTGEADLDFAKLLLTALTIDGKASLVNLTLPEQAGETAVKVQGSASTYNITVPPGVAVQIRAANQSSGLIINLARFPVKQEGRLYRSPDYDTAANRIDIEVDLNFGSVQVM
jgi:uncharacterized membrane protein